MKTNRNVATIFYFLLVFILVGSIAVAQSYPTKPIRMVVGLAPGGGTDTITRLIAQKLNKTIPQQIIVDNRPGASGNIAAEIVARSDPDGYNLLVVTASHAINPFLYKEMGYDPIKDFAPITQFTNQAYLFVVHPSVEAKNVNELISLAKAMKGGINYASSGVGLLGHLAMEQLKLKAKFEAIHIPYKGAAPALAAIIGGQVHAFFPTVVSGLPHVKSGKLRAIGITSAKRSPLLPDLPTIAEQGFPGYEVSGWYGILAPAGTPKNVIQYLYREIAEALKDSDVVKSMANIGAEPVGNTPVEFSEYIKTENKTWGDLIKQLGLKAK